MALSRMFLSIVGALALFTVVGCQSSTPASSQAPAAPERAIVVSGNAGSVTVFVPAADKVHAEVLASSGGHVCADCKAAAEHYFLTGELVAKCPSCGGVRTPVTLTIPSVSHN